jgi:hypothetical protein
VHEIDGHGVAALVVCRAEVNAGFYTGWDGSSTSTDCERLALLLRERANADDYPFTPAELERMEHYRAAATAGYYSEDQPIWDEDRQ